MKHLLLLISAMFLLVGCDRSSAPDAAGSVESAVGEVDSTPFVLETAFEKAKAENKSILLEFTGSDWCPPCKQLEKEVLGTAEFKQYEAANLIFGKLDFPNRKEQSPEVKKNNATLAEKFNINAFPTLVLLKSDGTELWRQEGYGGSSPKEFINQIEAKKQ